MAKGSSSKSGRSAYGSPTSLTSLLSPVTVSALPTPTLPEQTLYQKAPAKYDPLSDRRRYHPQTNARPAHSLIKTATRLVNRPETDVPHFRIPNLVGICVRRKLRREVLFALDRTNRKGRGSGKPRKRNNYSGIKC